MLTPRFWRNNSSNSGMTTFFLTPFSWIWTLGLKYRLNVPSHKVKVPVICIGNINLGGVGKTPTVIAFTEKLKEIGLNPHIVSKGYRGKLGGPVLVTEKHNSKDVGDEPILLSSFAPTWVSKDRVKGAKEAVENGCDIIILDDGFQNGHLHKDFSVIVVDSKRGFGNERVFPAGPLRESLDQGLKRADLMLLVGDEPDRVRFLNEKKEIQLEICEASVEVIETGFEWKNARVLAFAGIGNPEKFFESLRTVGANILKKIPLSDHANLNRKLILRLLKEAKEMDAILVTTEKDAVRLPEEFKSEILTLPVRLLINDWEKINKQIEQLTSNN
jgi:tetraacyldisaccharide 4'-kinase